MLTDEHLCNRGGAIFNRSFPFQFQAYALKFNVLFDADVLPPSNGKPEKIMKHGNKYFPVRYKNVCYGKNVPKRFGNRPNEKFG